MMIPAAKRTIEQFKRLQDSQEKYPATSFYFSDGDYFVLVGNQDFYNDWTKFQRQKDEENSKTRSKG